MCLFVGVSDRLSAIVDSLSGGEQCELPKSVSQKSDPYRSRPIDAIPTIHRRPMLVRLSVCAEVMVPPQSGLNTGKLPNR